MSGPQRILVLARTVSILGNFAAPIGLSFAVLTLAPGSEAASRLALVLVASAVPQLLFLAIGGVGADRGHRRLLAVGGETAAGLAEAASAALLLTHLATVGALAGLAAAQGAFSAAGTPAMRAMAADLADRTDQVASVNAVLSGGRAIATIAGPALGGLLVTSAGPGWALAANAASYAVAAVLLSLLSLLRPSARSAHQSAGSRPGNLRQLRDGWTTIARSAWLWPLMLYGMLFVLLVDAPYQLISPLLSRQHYGGAIALAVSTTAFGVGSVAGSGIAWRIRPQRPLLVYVALYFLEIPLRLAWALLVPLPVLAVSAGMAGLSFAAASSLWQTVLATRIASWQLGTVSAADEASGALANPLAIAITAPLIAALGARTIMAGGLLWLVASTIALTALTAIRDPMASDDQNAASR